MKTRKKKGGIFNSGTRRLRSRLKSRLKNLRKKKSRNIYIPNYREVPPKEEANSQSSRPKRSQSKISPPKKIPLHLMSEVKVDVIGEDGKPISTSQNCIPITKDDKKILNKGKEIAEILNEIVIKKQNTIILKDILDIDLAKFKKNPDDFRILNEIIVILNYRLGFVLRKFVPCQKKLINDYKSLNDKNLKAILENLNEEIETIKNLKTE
jgi:hypothetical protein